MLVGRSLSECTQQSTFPAASASSSSFVNSPFAPIALSASSSFLSPTVLKVTSSDVRTLRLERGLHHARLPKRELGGARRDSDGGCHSRKLRRHAGRSASERRCAVIACTSDAIVDSAASIAIGNAERACRVARDRADRGAAHGARALGAERVDEVANRRGGGEGDEVDGAASSAARSVSSPERSGTDAIDLDLVDVRAHLAHRGGEQLARAARAREEHARATHIVARAEPLDHALCHVPIGDHVHREPAREQRIGGSRAHGAELRSRERARIEAGDRAASPRAARPRCGS